MENSKQSLFLCQAEKQVFVFKKNNTTYRRPPLSHSTILSVDLNI